MGSLLSEIISHRLKKKKRQSQFMEPGPPAPLETNTEILPFMNPRREIEKTDGKEKREVSGK